MPACGGVLAGEQPVSEGRSAEQAIAAGDADLIAFGRPYISNPDLVERLRHGWPLAEPADMAAWYSPTGAAGYTDFPAYVAG